MRRFIWLWIWGLVFSLCIGCIALDRASRNIPSAAANVEIYMPPRKDFRAVVISDLNSEYGSTEYEPEVDAAIALIPQWQPDIVICGGDMVAGQKTSLTDSNIKAMWAAFDRHVTAPIRSYNIPFAFTIGNHDGSGAIKDGALIFERERDLARTYWQQHQQQLGLEFVDEANFPFYYSFKLNGIFFLVWDASSQNISQQQLDWVRQTLNNSAARQASAKIAIGHLPLYPIAKGKNKPGEYLAHADRLRSLLEKNVLMYVTAHNHAYYPGKIGNLQLLHAGALGQGARQLINSNLLPSKTLTIIDLELDPVKIAYTTYDAKTWKLISHSLLPESISGDYGSIIRQDLQ